jgi:septum site-determining protein MinC
LSRQSRKRQLLLLMKPSPTRISQLEPRPPLQRLRERLRGAMSRFGGWAKRFSRQEQPPEPANPLPARPTMPDVRTTPARLGERSGSREHSDRPAGRSAPVRRVTPTRLSQTARSQRSYLTESMGRVSERGERGGANSTVRAGEPPGPRAQSVPQTASAAEGQANQEHTSLSAGDPPAEQPPVPPEEARRTLERSLLKGTRNGMLLTLEPGYPWEQVILALSARLAESPTFFQRSVLSIDTRRRPLQPAEMEELGALLAPYEMTFKEVGSDELADPRQLPSGARRDAPAGDTAPLLAIRPGRDVTNALITRRTVRSGQQLQYEGSVVIMGDVNAGAEVIAGGDVIVWGTLRGTVHAGYPGNEEAVVCALTLAPVQLRIGTHASRPPEDDLPSRIPEIASVKEGQIVVESWNAGRSYRR